MTSFDESRAKRTERFIERFCVHTKGRFAKTPFILAPWQRDGIIRPLFGSVRLDDHLNEYVRKYSLAWIELGRKNGKSELLAALALYGLCGDREESAEVYGAACDRDQAALVYAVAKRMVELSPILSQRLTVIDSKKRIVDPRTNSFYQVIAADAGGNLGQNPSMILFDEVLTQPNRDLWDALKTAFGTRAQSLMVAATTAGTSGDRFCLEEHEYGERLLASREAGIDTDPSRFVFMRNTPKDADWRDESTWFYPNPALGDFLNINSLRAEAAEAAQKPQAQNAFRQFRLNQWVSQASRWLDMTLWDEGGEPLDEEALLGERCYGGLDLASTTDFAAWVLVFPTDDGGYVVRPHFFLPRTMVEKRSKMKAELEVWEKAGHITVTEGDTIDYDTIEARMFADQERYRLKYFGYDPYNATQLVTHAENGGLVGIKVPQSTARLNAPAKDIERALGARTLAHGGHPVLRWMADNVQVSKDKDGNIKPSRKDSADKIDGIVAMANGVFAALVPHDDEDDNIPEVLSLDDYLSDEDDEDFWSD